MKQLRRRGKYFVYILLCMLCGQTIFDGKYCDECSTKWKLNRKK